MSLINSIKNAADAISSTPASLLASTVRIAFIQYFLHTSRGNIEFIDGGEKNTLNLKTPVFFNGKGKISLAPNVIFGVLNSPGNLSYSYIAALEENASVTFGKDTSVNNRASIVASDTSITIGERCLIGPDFTAGDSNGHDLPVANRLNPDSRPKPVIIGNDVFIGARVTILKGVTIGNGCVIAAGAVLMPGFTSPDNKVIAGNPAVIIKDVPQ